MTNPAWVLVTDGSAYQTRSTLAAVRALAAAGYRPVVTVSGPSSIAAASRDCAGTIRTPLADEPGYADAIRAELASRAYLTVLPASDASLLALAAPVGHLVDKESAAERARAVGLDVPATRRFEGWSDLMGHAEELEYPVVVKPSISRFGARRVESPGRLRALEPGAGPLLVQPYLTQGLRAVAGIVWRGDLAAAVHQRYLRTWPPDCGTASAAETVAPDEELEARLVDLLSGYDGIFQAQLAGPYLLDLNLRVYGSLPLAVAAGANLAAIWCQIVSGKRPPAMVRARAGVFYRWIEGDLRHLASRVRSGMLSPGRALLELRPRRGAAHSTESLRDPKPMLARVRFAVGRRP